MNKEQMKPLLAESSLMLVDAMKQIDANAKGILFLTNKDQVLQGVLTDGDIRRWIIQTAKLEVTAGKVMNKTPKYLNEFDRHKGQELLKHSSITAVPVVNDNHQVVEIILRDEAYVVSNKTQDLSDVIVIVMAGGKGTRLYPYTKILPKPLIPIGEIPIMERIINRFCDYGVNHFFVTMNYKKNMIRSYFEENPHEYTLDYVEEDKPLGTAGSIRMIQERFEKPMIITNCDILIQADYGDIYRHHVESGNVITMVTAIKNIRIPYGVIKTQENGIIASMEEKPSLSYFVNTGVYIINPEMVERIPEDTFFHMTDLTEAVMKENLQVGIYPISEDAFLDMGEFEEMYRMERKLNLE